jgi:hypothetical protein
MNMHDRFGVLIIPPSEKQTELILVGTIVDSERGYSDSFPVVEWESNKDRWPVGTMLYALEPSVVWGDTK